MNEVSTYTSHSLFHSTLLTVLQLYIRIILLQAQCCREETDRPLIYSDEEDAVVQTMPIIRHHQIDLFIWGQEGLQRNIRIHQDGVAIMPEKPLQSFRSWLGKFGSKNREQEGMFGPKTRQHALAKYELGVPVEVIVNLVRSDGGFVDGIFRPE